MTTAVSIRRASNFSLDSSRKWSFRASAYGDFNFSKNHTDKRKDGRLPFISLKWICFLYLHELMDPNC
jgi:hypothetical protein